MRIWQSFHIFFVLLEMSTADNATVSIVRQNDTQKLFVVLPPSNWKTAAEFCPMTLVSIQDQTSLVKANTILTSSQHDAAWTGTKIKYSRWTAFIGCSGYFSSINQLHYATLKECILYCSDQLVSYLAFENGGCFCLDVKPNVNTMKNSCRKKCLDSSEFVCHEGPSALILEFIESVPNLVDTRRYIEEECIAVSPQHGTRTIHNCISKIAYGCTAAQFEVNPMSWYFYQEECLGRGHSVLYGKNVSNSAEKRLFWTPLFRVHAISEGSIDVDTCNKAMTIRKGGGLFVENCSLELPFVCSVPDKNIEDYVSAGSHLTYLLIVLVIVLLALVVAVTTLSWNLRKAKVAIRLLNLSADRKVQPVDTQGYLLPERYYSTILENPEQKDTAINLRILTRKPSEVMPKSSNILDTLKKKFLRRNRVEVQTPAVQYSPTCMGIEDNQGYLTSDHYYKSIPDSGDGGVAPVQEVE